MNRYQVADTPIIIQEIPLDAFASYCLILSFAQDEVSFFVDLGILCNPLLGRLVREKEVTPTTYDMGIPCGCLLRQTNEKLVEGCCF
jgi:hypothetical protein